MNLELVAPNIATRKVIHGRPNPSALQNLEKIGQRGMSDAYRATDTKLGHDVAIKVLPQDFPKDTERASRGLIPVGEALVPLKQITERLCAAHEKGVVHRDLKPGNFKMTADGKTERGRSIA